MRNTREKVVATESALKGRACKPLADGSVLLSVRGAAALLDNAVVLARPYVNYACRDDSHGFRRKTAGVGAELKESSNRTAIDKIKIKNRLSLTTL